MYLCTYACTCVKISPKNRPRRPRVEWRYSSTLSLTSALDGVGRQLYAPTTLPPRKTQCPLYRRLGGPQCRSGEVRKFSPPPGLPSSCVYTRMYILHVCTCVRMYLCMYVLTYVCVVCMYVHMYVFITHIYARVYVCMYVCMCTMASRRIQFGTPNVLSFYKSS